MKHQNLHIHFNKSAIKKSPVMNCTQKVRHKTFGVHVKCVWDSSSIAHIEWLLHILQQPILFSSFWIVAKNATVASECNLPSLFKHISYMSWYGGLITLKQFCHLVNIKEKKHKKHFSMFVAPSELLCYVLCLCH